MDSTLFPPGEYPTEQSLRYIQMVWHDCLAGDTRLAAYIRSMVQKSQGCITWDHLRRLGIEGRQVIAFERQNRIAVAVSRAERWRQSRSLDAAEALCSHLALDFPAQEAGISDEELDELELAVGRPLGARNKALPTNREGLLLADVSEAVAAPG